MKLKSISITNFRCIEQVQIDIRNFTSLIGPNNCGKSSAIRAIEIFLNQQSPDLEEWRKGHEAEPIVIECEFDDLQGWEKATQGVSGLVYDNKILLKLTLSSDPGTGKIKKEYEAFKPEETIIGWADKFSGLSDELKAIAAEMGITTAGAWKGVAKLEQVKQRIRETKPALIAVGEAKWSADSVSIDSALQQALPQAQLIPAVRDATDDGKPGAKTSFGIILSKILLPAIQASQEYTEVVNSVEKLQAKLTAEGADQIQKVGEVTKMLTERLSSIIDAKVLLSMSTPDAEKFIGANTGLELDDETKTSIGLQGNGLQRSLVFALMETLATQKALIPEQNGNPTRTRSTIILFEEPELFMHPHIMRSLKRSLSVISKKPDWQVVLTTHSPFMIDIGEDPMSLVVFRRENSKAAPEITQLKADPFGQGEESDRDREALRAALDFHPTVCEAFFGKRTLLVEGDSEMALFTYSVGLYQKAGVNIEKRLHCTVVSCGGKWTIPPIANLLKHFKIPFRIIHDMDGGGRSPEELAASIAIDPYRANARIAQFADPANILIIEDTLEDLFWAQRPKSSNDKPYRIWKRANELVESAAPLNPKIIDLVKFAVDW
jgi:hypothetical protein